MQQMLLSDADKTKEARVKQTNKVYHSRVLRNVKAQHSQLSHMNWLQIDSCVTITSGFNMP